MKLIFPKKVGEMSSNTIIIDGESIEARMTARRVASRNSSGQRWLYTLKTNSSVQELVLKKYLALRRIELIFKEDKFSEYEFLNKYDSHLHEVLNFQYTQELLDKLLEGEPKKNNSPSVIKPLPPIPARTSLPSFDSQKNKLEAPLPISRISSNSMGEVTERLYREEVSQSPQKTFVLDFGNYKLFFRRLNGNKIYQCSLDENFLVKSIQIRQLISYIETAIHLLNHTDIKASIAIRPSQRALILRHRILRSYLESLSAIQVTSLEEDEASFLSNSFLSSHIQRVCLYKQKTELPLEDIVSKLTFSEIILQLADDHALCFKTKAGSDKYYLNYSVCNLSKDMAREYQILLCYFQFCLQKFDVRELREELSSYKSAKDFYDIASELITAVKIVKNRFDKFNDISSDEPIPDQLFEMEFSSNLMRLLMEPCLQKGFKLPLIEEDFFKPPIASRPEPQENKVSLPELYNEEEDEDFQRALAVSLQHC